MLSATTLYIVLSMLLQTLIQKLGIIINNSLHYYTQIFHTFVSLCAAVDSPFFFPLSVAFHGSIIINIYIQTLRYHIIKSCILCYMLQNMETGVSYPIGIISNNSLEHNIYNNFIKLCVSSRAIYYIFSFYSSTIFAQCSINNMIDTSTPNYYSTNFHSCVLIILQISITILHHIILEFPS